VLTATTDVSGLPALPAVAIGFLLANADLLWRALRRRGLAPARIYGRADADFHDLEADVIERGPARIVLLTRERPPVTVSVEPADGGAFAEEPAGGSPLLCRVVLGNEEPGLALVHDLPHGVVVLPRREAAPAHDDHPEQLAADEAKVERLLRERR
jgi:hypothetical protein